MNIQTLIGVELQKIRRSKILLILLTAAVILWIPSVRNAELNFSMQAEGISPEHNFLIQGFLGMTWFMYPAGMAAGTVLLIQTERSNGGILKMLTLPLNPAKLCLSKFIVLLLLAVMQVLLITGMYFISAAIATRTQHYDFMLSPLFVLKEAGLVYLSPLPMLAVFWMLAVCIRTPIFAIGAELVSLVPSVLMINTKLWVCYPMAYPLFVVTSEYGKLASHLTPADIRFIPWIPIAVLLTVLCLIVSFQNLGKRERS